jgi:TRAP-type C4-dicarboxylate transport system substrate-binding protein
MVVAPNIGGILLVKARLDALRPEQRAVVLDTGRLAAKALTERIRREDAEAFERLKKRMTLVESTPAEQAAWKALFADARLRLTKGTLPPELMREVEGLLAR